MTSHTNKSLHNWTPLVRLDFLHIYFWSQILEINQENKNSGKSYLIEIIIPILKYEIIKKEVKHNLNSKNIKGDRQIKWAARARRTWIAEWRGVRHSRGRRRSSAKKSSMFWLETTSAATDRELADPVGLIPDQVENVEDSEAGWVALAIVFGAVVSAGTIHSLEMNSLKAK